MPNEIYKNKSEFIMEIKQTAELFHLLGDYNRLKIFLLIADRERSVKEIVEITRLSQSNVSHHLKLLRENELVQSYRVGKSIIYTLSNQFKLSPRFELFLKINYGRK